MKGTLVMFIGFLPSVGHLEGTLEGTCCHVTLIPSSWGTFGWSFGVLNWIPSKWGMFGGLGHLGDFNCISSNWGTCKGDIGDGNWILLSWGLHGDVN